MLFLCYWAQEFQQAVDSHLYSILPALFYNKYYSNFSIELIYTISLFYTIYGNQQDYGVVSCCYYCFCWKNYKVDQSITIINNCNNYLNQHQPMRQPKQHNYSTYQSRRNTQIIASRFKEQFKYDINDYLPPDHEVKINYQYFSFGKFEDMGLSNCVEKDRRSMKSVGSVVGSLGEESGDVGGIMDSMRKLEQSKNNEIKKITVQFAEKQKALQQKIKQLQKQIEQINQRQEKIQTQNTTYASKITKYIQQLNIHTQKLKQLEINYSNAIKQKSQLEHQLISLKKKLQSKQNNIRIFYQKYEVSYQPKPKHSYTIQVQTDLQQPKQSEILSNISMPEIIKSYPQQPASTSIVPEVANRKMSGSSKPQLYQLYQQQQFQANEQFDLNSQVTSRSQVLPSGAKPRKPAFMQNTSELNNYNYDKQNDRKRINQRIESRLPNTSQERETQKQKKMKIRNQQIEIYPIDCDQIEDIVYGILAMK